MVVCPQCPEHLYNSTAEYYVHLATDVHQRRVHSRRTCAIYAGSETSPTVLNAPIFVQWTRPENDRAIVLNEFNTLVSDPAEILQHFANYGFVTNFVYDPRLTYAIVQFQTKFSVDEVMRQKTAKQIRGRIVRVRKKEYVSMIEWIAVLDLNGKYNKVDQQFFIRHIENTATSVHLPIELQLQNWIHHSSLSAEDITVRQTIIRDLVIISSQTFPKAYVYPLFPLVEGLQENDSIFEIFMDPFGVYGANISSCNIPDYTLPTYQSAIVRILFLMQNQSVLPNYEKYCSEVQIFPENAGIETIGSHGPPIRGVNFYHKGSGVRCRLRFDAVMEAHVASVITFMLSLDIRVAPFIRFLHYWARLYRLTEHHPEILDILTMMSFLFFSKTGILPSIAVLQDLARPSSSQPQTSQNTLVEGWDVSYVKDINKVETYLMTTGKLPYGGDYSVFPLLTSMNRPKPSIGTPGTLHLFRLLADFFAAFGAINCKEYVLCPYVCDCLGVEIFMPGSEESLLPAYKLYKERVKSGFCRLKIGRAMTLQHPFHHGLNITESLDDSFVREMQQAFKTSFDRIMRFLQSPNHRIMDIFPDCHELLLNNPPNSTNSSSPTTEIQEITGVTTEDEKSESENENGEKRQQLSPVEQIPTSTTTTLTYSLAAKKATLLDPATTPSIRKESNPTPGRSKSADALPRSSNNSPNIRDFNCNTAKIFFGASCKIDEF